MISRTSSRFPDALRFARKARGLTQEDFDEVTSRVYVSALERGRKQPTLATIETLATVIKVHPLTLLAASYCELQGSSGEELDRLLDQVRVEAKKLREAQA